MVRCARNSWALFFLPHFCKRICARAFPHRVAVFSSSRNYPPRVLSVLGVGCAGRARTRTCTWNSRCNYGGQRLGCKRSCRTIREFAAHNRRWELRRKWSPATCRAFQLLNTAQFAPRLNVYHSYRSFLSVMDLYKYDIDFSIAKRWNLKQYRKLLTFRINYYVVIRSQHSYNILDILLLLQ